MNRSIIYDQEQVREFDHLWGWKDTLESISYLMADMGGSLAGFVAGLAGTQSVSPSLTIQIGAGRIYQNTTVDATTYGNLPSDATLVMQQGYAAAQPITLSTAGISAGQSQWALVQAQFSQVDAIRAGDPTGGVLYYFNSSNPSSPFVGPGNSGTPNNTIRQGVCAISVVTGAAATTGSEVPPNPTAGWVPLYLIDLTFGQTTIITAQILTAGPSVGTGVPSNYPRAPFIAGLFNQHHLGIIGQAPQIDLTSEVKNTLPMARLPASNTVGGLASFRLNAGNPNGAVAGNANVNGASDLVYDTTNNVLWVCTTTGTSGTAVWQSATVAPVQSKQIVTASTTLTVSASIANYIFNRTVAPAAMNANLPATGTLTDGQTIRFTDIAGTMSAAAVSLVANSGQTIAGAVGGTPYVWSGDFTSIQLRWIASITTWAVEGRL